ncbi:hypothetical protein AALO_G00256630 [Alosa alosa]|uniref:Uncharacterized protein n=1 Tax=Alosa alosa TaxID=278164 RepID=A0AAV6FSE1_9TELE|nr:uncharacterized protein si:ch211-191i18.2 [Alosa alosa]KAG5264662.1 hypothetical protein AALO_G00256630 [Alosa alosa]
MYRLPHLTVCLVGALLLMPFCRAESDFEEYDTTALYEDYNATFEYSFYSNSSVDDLDKFLLEAGDTGDVEPGTDVTPTEEVTEGEEVETVEMEDEVTITKPPTSRHIPTDEACRTTSPCMLVALGLISHQLARLL